MSKKKNALKNTKLINSKRQSKNLKQLLSKAWFIDRKTEKVASVTKCNRSNCDTWPHLLEGNSFLFKNNSNFRILENMSCASKNLIYVIKCAGCGEEYIGQTGDVLRARVQEKKQQIKTPRYRCIPLTAHIDECAIVEV